MHRTEFCNFCLKTRNQVKGFISGLSPNVAMCDECVYRAYTEASRHVRYIDPSIVKNDDLDEFVRTGAFSQ